MGKLNYTNRKVEGIKLGQIVAKDLVRSLLGVVAGHKLSLSLSQMKRIPPGSATKAALRDPYVELDVSGKRLTDSGFAELALGLISSTTFESEHGKAVRVEELSLADNSLTAKSLQALSSVLHLAANDLRDLDLSGNDITVTSDEEAFAWAEFLTSFRRCSVLSRVDFSGNALGPRAFEIFARVYGQEELLDFLTVEVAETIGPQDDVADSGAARVHSSSIDLDR
ncbi:MAG: hypothetical protein M1830_003807 [Pleopsidium flavum]|nr:MAG: hypothetical protein M1830_003807 [Pleopsidium flavum]